jgi:hypothetical protein
MSKKQKRQANRPMTVMHSKAAEFNPDYSSTKRELKRLAVLWVALVAVIVVLAIFQNQIISLFVK